MLKKQALLIFILMFVTTLLMACGGTLETAAVSAQEPKSQPGTITVVGQGQAVGEPDQAQVNVGVEIFAKKVEEATSENEAIVQAIMAALAEQNVKRQDIHTLNYGLWAEQIYGENGPEGISGYRVTNQVHITVRDIDTLGDVLAAVIDAGANSIHGITFTASDTEALAAEARKAAMADARQRANSLADLGNVELGEIQVISEMVGQPVFPFEGPRGGVSDQAVPPSIAPGQLSYQVSIMVTFGLK